MNRNRLLFIQIQTLAPSMHHKWKEIIDIVCITTIGKFIGDLLLMKSPIELKDNFNVFDLIKPV